MSELAEVMRLNRMKLTERQSVFDELLTRYTDAASTVNRGQSNGDPGSGLLLMSSVWTPTYRALERLLRVYRVYSAKRAEVGLGETTRTDYWHLAQWYLLCRRYPQWPKKRTVQRGREMVEIQPPVEWVVQRSAGVQWRTVLAGVIWLDDEWARSVTGRRLDFDAGGRLVEMGEPERPKEFRAEVGERVAA